MPVVQRHQRMIMARMLTDVSYLLSIWQHAPGYWGDGDWMDGAMILYITLIPVFKICTYLSGDNYCSVYDLFFVKEEL